MATLYDTIIIGAGHNGLTAAAYLAQAGQKVLVLERRAQIGGAVITEEVWPGYHVDTVFHRGQIAADVVQDLNLGRHGLQLLPPGPVYSPRPEGGGVWLSPDAARTRESLRQFAPADAERWDDFVKFMNRVAGLLREVYALTMPRVPEIPAADLPALGRLALQWRALGKTDMMDVLRVLPMSARELLDEWFQSEAVKGALGALGVQGLRQGPYSAGTAFLLLHHWTLNGGPFKATARGGVGAFTQALAAAARGFGAELRAGAEVAQISIQAGRATGVALASGEVLTARRVVSAADPRRTLLGLVDPLELEPEFIHAAQVIKLRGAVAKVNLALAGRPEFRGLADEAALRGTIVISPSLSYLERAYDDAKYGRLSAQPQLEVTIPTLADPGLAPAGKHILSIWLQYAPYHLRAGTWDDQREALGDLAVKTLAEYAPNLPGLIEQRQVLTPLDLERTYGLTEGNVYHGEMMLDQIVFMRPIPGWGQYRTPIANLFLCGPGTHPGGGVSGWPGRNAAREILKG